MSGYLKLYRKIFSSDVWLSSTASQQIIIINLLGMAGWSSVEVVLPYSKKVVSLLPGQFITTNKDIENACNAGGIKRVSEKQIRIALQNLEKLNFITVEKASTLLKDGKIITIVKWNYYQGKIANDEGKQNGKQKGNEKGKQDEPEKPHWLGVSESESCDEGKQNGKQKGKQNGKHTNIYKNYKKEKNNINNNAREQTIYQNQVNQNSTDPADTVKRCMDYYQKVIHPFCNTVEKEAVMQLAGEYAEYDFMRATDKARENGVNHTRTWKYIAKILDTGGVKDFAQTNQRKNKNDVQATTEEALKILERGDLIDL